MSMERSYMKLTNTHRLILEMLLHHPEGIRREEINEVLKREGERVLDDRRRLYKYLDSFRKSLGLNIATVHLGATDFKYRLCDTKGMPTGFAEQMVTNILENDFLQTFKDLGSRIQAVRIPRGSNFLKTIGLAMRNKRLLRVTYQKFDDVAPYDCILAPHALNVAKVMMRDNEQPYSMASFKSLMFNSYYTKRIFDVSRIRRTKL